MENYIQADDYEPWMIIENGPLIPKKATEDGKIVPKEPQELNPDDFKMMEKNAKAKSFCTLVLDPMSKLISQNLSQPRRYGMPYE